jgi:hypothetical protein
MTEVVTFEGDDTFTFAAIFPFQFRKVYPKLSLHEFADKPQNLADSGETKTKKRKRAANGK